MSQVPAEVLSPNEEVIQKFVDIWKEAPKRQNPPAFNNVKQLLAGFGICDEVEAVQTKSGLGTGVELSDGKSVTIGRRYGYVVRSSQKLIDLFCLPPCRYLVFFTETRTLSQSFSSTLLFVGTLLVTGEGARAKVTKMTPHAFIDTNSKTVFAERDEVIKCFLRFEKTEKATSGRKQKCSRNPSPVVNTDTPCDSVEREAPASCEDGSSIYGHVEAQEDEHQEVKQEQEQVEVAVADDDVAVPENQCQIDESGILGNQTPEEDVDVDVDVDVDDSSSPEFICPPIYTAPLGEEFGWSSYPSGDEMGLFVPEGGDDGYSANDVVDAQETPL